MSLMSEVRYLQRHFAFRISSTYSVSRYPRVSWAMSMFNVFNLCKKLVLMRRQSLLFIRRSFLVFSGIVVPNQAKSFQLLDACSIECGRLGGNELSVLSSLTLDPSRKLGASLVTAWNEAVSVKHLEVLQFHELVIPSGKV